MTDDISDDVRTFILENFDSVEEVEVLLLLMKDPRQFWDPESVSQALYTSPSAAEKRLKDLVAHQLATTTADAIPKYQYRSETNRDLLTAKLADAYQTRRVAVIALIYSQASHEVRAFADAFKLRKEK